MVYGFIPDQFDHYMSHDRHIRGWTFSIEDMAKFGVDNVTYEGNGEYPSEKAIENFPVAVLNVPTTTIPPAVVPPPGSPPTPEPSATIEPDFQVGADPLAEPHPAEITVDGDTVVISGDLNDNAYIRFRSEIVGREEEISAIRINSKYGDVVQAIFDRLLDLRSRRRRRGRRTLYVRVRQLHLHRWQKQIHRRYGARRLVWFTQRGTDGG